MPLYTWDGKLLTAGGALATAEACCCDQGETCFLICSGGSGQVLEVVIPAPTSTAVVSGLQTGICSPNPCSNLNGTYNLSGGDCQSQSQSVNIAACQAVVDIVGWTLFYEINGPNCDLIILFEMIDLPGGQFTTWQWVERVTNPPSPYVFNGATLTVRNDLIPDAWCGPKNGGSQVVISFP